MKSFNRLIRNKAGFSLVEIMVAIGLVGGIAVVVMNLSKQGADIQRSSMAGNDEAEMISKIRTILTKTENCNESLKLGVSRTPVVFKKRDVDEPAKGEGVDTVIYQRAIDGSVKPVFVGDPDVIEGNFGKLKIQSIKLIMANGQGFNYPADAQHSDTGIIRINYEKPAGKNYISKVTDVIITVSMSTTSSGNTTALSCSKDSGIMTKTEATVENMSISGYVHGWDAAFTYYCPGNKVLCGEISYHSNSKEDRRHSFKCCDMKVDGQTLPRKSCSWSGQINTYDALINFTCPNDTIAAGHFSHHDNGTEDRVYQFYCCEYGSGNQRVEVEECKILPNSGWANNWDQALNFTCPAGKVRVGEMSIHSNDKEDRLYRFKCCNVVVEEFQ